MPILNVKPRGPHADASMPIPSQPRFSMEIAMTHLAADLSRTLAAAVITAAALAGCAGAGCRSRCNVTAGACSSKKCGPALQKSAALVPPRRQARAQSRSAVPALPRNNASA